MKSSLTPVNHGNTGSDDHFPAQALVRRYERAKAQRSNWEEHWRDCYDYAMPQRDGALSNDQPGSRKTDHLFDGTAPDAVEQLAASLMAELTPPWSRWFDIVPGPDVAPEEADKISGRLEEISAQVQSQFDRSNFAVEIHQCYLDLVTVGTASLLFEEAPVGEPALFRFSAVPIAEAVMEEGPGGLLDTTFRKSSFTEAGLRDRFPSAELNEHLTTGETDWGEKQFTVLEAVVPEGRRGFSFHALLTGETAIDVSSAHDIQVIADGRFAHSPFINFRWMKAPGEAYGRSLVMKALPDIKTANKVVELILKNATIAVTGIWQADDDGVLNPSTVKLLPGTIIPKAVGSSGLTPLQAPGNFDMSSLILEQLRTSIRAGLLADKLGGINGPKMTATEVLERSAEMARQLGATYGRLQAELLLPLAKRAIAILSRRGEIPDIIIDGREIDLKIVSPIALHRQRAEAQSALQWFEMAALFGPEAQALVKPQEAARWLARSFRVPETLLRTKEEVVEAQKEQGVLHNQSDPLAGAIGEFVNLATASGVATSQQTPPPVDPTAGMSALAPAANLARATPSVSVPQGPLGGAGHG